MKNVDKNYWPIISYSSLIIFINVTVFVVLHAKLNFTLYATVVIIPIFFWPMLKAVLDEVGYGKRVKKVWHAFPNLMHKGISLFCLFWSGYLFFKVIIPTLKRNYDKNE